MSRANGVLKIYILPSPIAMDRLGSIVTPSQKDIGGDIDAVILVIMRNNIKRKHKSK